MAGYKGFTEAQAKAHKKYMENVATIQVRTSAERRDAIKAFADASGESVNAFINRAIDESMDAAGPRLPDADSARIKEHVQKTGEEPAAFVSRAVSDTIARDSQLLKMGLDPTKR